jgi:hypothetical protein
LPPPTRKYRGVFRTFMLLVLLVLLVLDSEMVLLP